MNTDARGDGLELAVKLRSQADENPLAMLLWQRLVYAEDPDAEAEAITAQMAEMCKAVTAIIEAAKPVLSWWMDVAGPN